MKLALVPRRSSRSLVPARARGWHFYYVCRFIEVDLRCGCRTVFDHLTSALATGSAPPYMVAHLFLSRDLAARSTPAHHVIQCDVITT